MEKETLIMKYISVWNWHILGFVSLASAFIIVFSGDNLGNNVMFAVFLFMWVVSEGIALRKKTTLESEEEKEGEDEQESEDI